LQIKCLTVTIFKEKNDEPCGGAYLKLLICSNTLNDRKDNTLYNIPLTVLSVVFVPV
jgi:hypothetical protein